MPRFYFHIYLHNDEQRLDPEGGDYAHVGEAQKDLIRTLRGLLQDGRISLDQVAHWVFHLTDENGVVHATMPVKSAIEEGPELLK